jgi:hypothetical protein
VQKVNTEALLGLSTAYRGTKVWLAISSSSSATSMISHRTEMTMKESHTTNFQQRGQNTVFAWALVDTVLQET